MVPRPSGGRARRLDELHDRGALEHLHFQDLARSFHLHAANTLACWKLVRAEVKSMAEPDAAVTVSAPVCG
jgi:hypothetical protein